MLAVMESASQSRRVKMKVIVLLIAAVIIMAFARGFAAKQAIIAP
jgi:hypothetical protein